ncbi:MFS transporter [Endozoicomonadaceae bacterium StTr2]
MSKTERKAAVALSLVFSSRMLGLFMVLPVLSLYAVDLQGATPVMIGLAIGAYGITQALLQIPVGMLSDRIGRRPVIAGGLLLFALGSLVAAYSTSIEGVIAGRLLQGSGAIASAVTALLADITKEENRSKAMALFGMSIGLAFIVAMISGPVIAASWGLNGLFISNALLAITGIALLFTIVPAVPRIVSDRKVRLKDMAGNHWLQRLSLGVFVLHFVLTGLFMAVPASLETLAGLPREEHWWVYLLTLVTSFFAMVPFMIWGEKKQQLKKVLSGAVLLLTASFGLIMQWNTSLTLLIVAVFAFFMAFNLLEAVMPSLVSRIAPGEARGAAMGIYSTSQFAGAALGGVLSGYAMQQAGVSGVLMLCMIATALWWVISVTMKQPPIVSSMVLKLHADVPQDADQLTRTLADVAGVREVIVMLEEQVASLKVCRPQLDQAALRRYGDWN